MKAAEGGGWGWGQKIPSEILSEKHTCQDAGLPLKTDVSAIPSSQPIPSLTTRPTNQRPTPEASTELFSTTRTSRGLPTLPRRDARPLPQVSAGAPFTSAHTYVHEYLQAFRPRDSSSSQRQDLPTRLSTPQGSKMYPSFSAPAPPFKYAQRPISESHVTSAGREARWEL